jgi:hypothetical protein
MAERARPRYSPGCARVRSNRDDDGRYLASHPTNVICGVESWSTDRRREGGLGRVRMPRRLLVVHAATVRVELWD